MVYDSLFSVSMFSVLVDLVLMSFLGIIAIAVVRVQDLFAAVMLLGIFSLVSAALYVDLDAVDVAFTEAAVGAGISTVLLLATLTLTSEKETQQTKLQKAPLLVVMITGAALVYGTLDMPAFGDPNAPVHQHVAPRYIEDSGQEVGLPNIVTSILASYRGFDTLGEVVVVFTAAVGVLTLLSGHPNPSSPNSPASPPADTTLRRTEDASDGHDNDGHNNGEAS